MAHPRGIDIDLVNAQQARRILDRLVGYKLSPFLSQKIRRGLSAGRVQSVAVRLVVDREEEIRAFKPEEYWSIDAKFIPKGSRKQFPAVFYGTEAEKIKLSSKEEADKILEAVKDADFQITKLKKGTRRKSPAPPFITSTLQQEASRKLGFQARRTMKAAQELYEGVDIRGHGRRRLDHLYENRLFALVRRCHRGCSGNISGSRWGEKYLPKEARAILRPGQTLRMAMRRFVPPWSSLAPDQVKDSLTNDQYKLYKLIWERFLACQMAQCLQSTTQADITGERVCV